MKTLLMVCPLSYMYESGGRMRYEKFISERLNKKDYTDIFQLVYKEDTKNHPIIAMRWIKISDIKEDCWQQLFEFGQLFCYTHESLTFSFQDILIDRLHHVNVKEVDIKGDDKNSYLEHLKEILIKEKILPNIIDDPI